MKTNIIELVESINNIQNSNISANSGYLGATTNKDEVMTSLKRSAIKLMRSDDKSAMQENILDLRGNLKIAEAIGVISNKEAEDFNNKLDNVERSN